MGSERFCEKCGNGPLQDKRDTSVPLRMRHYARGLDGVCYGQERAGNRLANYPRARWDRRVLVEEWEQFRAFNVQRREAADLSGVSDQTLRHALRREYAARARSATTQGGGT